MCVCVCVCVLPGSRSKSRDPSLHNTFHECDGVLLSDSEVHDGQGTAAMYHQS